MKRLLIIILLPLIVATNLKGQACCSAGSPLVGSLAIASSADGNLQVGITYEFNSLQDVYSGTERLDDDLRERNVNSFILEANYGLS
ncbi:MAG: hypothetical protein JSW63_01610, partial [Ignavibacterium sp.]